MRYSTDLTDEEWREIEPLLLEHLPVKKMTRPLKWSRRDIFNAILYQLKNGGIWRNLPKDFPPYSTVYWHYKSCRDSGCLELLMQALHQRVREQAQKNRAGAN